MAEIKITIPDDLIKEVVDVLSAEGVEDLEGEPTQEIKNQLARDSVIDFIKTKVLHSRNTTALNSVDKTIDIL